MSDHEAPGSRGHGILAEVLGPRGPARCSAGRRGRTLGASRWIWSGAALESVREAPVRSEEATTALLTSARTKTCSSSSHGASYAQVAEIIAKPITVRNTIYRIEQKLGVTTKQEIVVWAVRHGLLDDEERVG